MRVVVQRAKEASVVVDKNTVGKIDQGLVVFAGFTHADNKKIIDKMVQKIINLRIFCDENDKMNLGIKDVKGSILSISQFTLYALLNGRRPSFTKALNYEAASKLYDYFNEALTASNVMVQAGIFGADMKVCLINDGPVTIVIDSEEDL